MTSEELSKEKVKKAINTVHEAAIQSLDPENFENICKALNQLADTRGILLDKL